MQITIVDVNQNNQMLVQIDNRLTVREALGVGHFYHLKSNTLLEPDVPMYMYENISSGDTLYHTKFVLKTFIKDTPFLLEEFLPVDWKNSDQVKIWIPHIPFDVMNLVQPQLYLDRDIRQALIDKTPAHLEYFVKSLRNREEELNDVISTNKHHDKLLPLLIKLDDLSLFRMLLSADGMALKSLPDNVKNDEEACRRAVGQNGLALRFASREMKNEPEVCHIAVTKNPNAYQYASEACRNHPGIITNTFRENADLTFSPQYVPNKTRNDSRFTSFVIQTKHFKYARDQAKSDLETARDACENDPNAFLYVGKNLLRDVKFVAWALEQEFNVENVPKRVLHIAMNYIDFTSEGNWYYGQKGTDD